MESFQEKFTFQGQLWNPLSIATQVCHWGLSSSQGNIGFQRQSHQVAVTAAFPVSKARRAPEAVTLGANSEHLETALTIWHWVSPEGLQWSGGGECKIFLLPGLSNAQKQCCQVPAKNEYIPEEFNKVQNKTNPYLLESRGTFWSPSLL